MAAHEHLAKRMAALAELLDEAANWNGGWLNGVTYSRWRNLVRRDGRQVPSRQALEQAGVSVAALARGMGIPDRAPRPTDDELLAYLVQAHDELGGDGLSAATYARWRKNNHLGAPGPSTLQKRFGGFSHAASLAGIPVISGNRTYSDTDLLAALAKASASSMASRRSNGRDRLTMAGYDAWRREQAVPGPTVLSITNRFGSWLAALEEAGL